MKQLEQCPICSNPDYKSYLKTKDYFLTQEDFTLVKCDACQFIFTNPVPQKTELSKYYDSPDYLSHTVSKLNITGMIYKLFRQINIRNKYKLIRKYKKGTNILDIGMGTGELMAYFNKKGWDIVGIEPNESARKFAAENHNIKVYDEDMLDELEKNSFDVITLWHVMEHVSDLKNRMEQIEKLVSKDGYVIIAVPNIDSPDSKKYKSHWAGLDVPRHLSHFTKDSMENLLSRYGLDLVDIYPMKFDAYYVSLLSEGYLKRKLPFFGAFKNGLRSNLAARKENNYSSMIFVARPK